MRHDTLERWRRRAFLKRSGAFLCSSAIPAGALLEAFSTGRRSGAGRAQEPARAPAARESRWSAQAWRGHMFPGAVAPFGLVQVESPTAADRRMPTGMFRATGMSGSTAPAISIATTSSTASATLTCKEPAASILATFC